MKLSDPKDWSCYKVAGFLLLWKGLINALFMGTV